MSYSSSPKKQYNIHGRKIGQRMVAINIADMTEDPIVSQFLIEPIADSSRATINAEPSNIDGSALLLSSDDPERVKAAIEVIRRKYGPNKFRIYESNTGKTWNRI